MKFPLFLMLIATAGCSTRVQDARSQDFRPVYPEPAAFAAQPPVTGGIYNAGTPGLFVMDRRASNVGDVLTVDLSERFSASKSQSAAASGGSDFEVDLPDFLPVNFADSELTSGAERSFKGRGSAAQSNSLRGRMTVSVVRVFPNGLLEITGEKKLTLNTGNEYVRLRGTVRPEDISADNVVASDRIANAQIEYIGAGEVADTARPGWLMRSLFAVSPI